MAGVVNVNSALAQRPGSEDRWNLFRETWPDVQLESLNGDRVGKVVRALGIKTGETRKAERLAAIANFIEKDDSVTKAFLQDAFLRFLRSCAFETPNKKKKDNTSKKVRSLTGSVPTSSTAAAKPSSGPSTQDTQAEEDEEDDDDEVAETVDRNKDTTSPVAGSPPHIPSASDAPADRRNVLQIKALMGLLDRIDVTALDEDALATLQQDKRSIVLDSQDFPIVSQFPTEVFDHDIFDVANAFNIDQFKSFEAEVPQIPGIYRDPAAVDVDLNNKLTKLRDQEWYHLQKAVRNVQAYLLRVFSIGDVCLTTDEERDTHAAQLSQALAWLGHIGGQISQLRRENILRKMQGKKGVKEARRIQDAERRRDVPQGELFGEDFGSQLKKRRKMEAELTYTPKGFFRGKKSAFNDRQHSPNKRHKYGGKPQYKNKTWSNPDSQYKSNKQYDGKQYNTKQSNFGGKGSKPQFKPFTQQ